MTRAIVYVRQSLDKTGEGAAVARQEEAARALCVARGWTVVEVIVENSVSATSSRVRPGYEKLLRRVEAGTVDVIVVYHVDRLVRRIADLENVIERCERACVRLATVSGDVDLSTDAGRLVGRILAAVARGEVERKGSRQKIANTQAARTGRPHGGPKPFGYAADRRSVIPAEATAIRDGYDAVLAGGSLRSVATDWNTRGLTTGRASAKTGGRWTFTAVRDVLLNPRNAGLRAHNGDVVGAGDWSAIVSEPTYRAVREILTDPSRRVARGQSRAMLTGIGLCGICGDGTTLHSGGSRKTGRIYRCSAPGPEHLAPKAAPIERAVSDVVINVLSRPDATDLLIDTSRADVDDLRTQAATLRARLDTLAVEFAEDDSVSPAQLRTASERLRARLHEVEARLADAGRVDVLGPLLSSGDVRSMWESDGFDADRQRAVIDTLMTVTVHPAGRGARVFDPSTVEIRPRAQVASRDGDRAAE